MDMSALVNFQFLRQHGRKIERFDCHFVTAQQRGLRGTPGFNFDQRQVQLGWERLAVAAIAQTPVVTYQ